MNPLRIPLPTHDSNRTVGAVRFELRQKLAEGRTCVCSSCGGSAKVYIRGIHISMVRALRAIALSPDGLTPTEVMSLPYVGGGDYAKLSDHNLISRTGNSDWRWIVTNDGRAFLSGKKQIPSKAIYYQGQCIGFDRRKMISIRDVKGFVDLDEILGSAAVGTLDREHEHAE